MALLTGTPEQRFLIYAMATTSLSDLMKEHPKNRKMMEQTGKETD